jgi:hypothetical protein
MNNKKIITIISLNLVPVSIGLSAREGRDPVGEDGGVAALEQDGEPGEQVPAGLRLLAK